MLYEVITLDERFGFAFIVCVDVSCGTRNLNGLKACCFSDSMNKVNSSYNFV